MMRIKLGIKLSKLSGGGNGRDRSRIATRRVATLLWSNVRRSVSSSLAAEGLSHPGRSMELNSYQSAHEEVHFVNRSGWLRAAVLGANDGIISISSLIVGVAMANPSTSAVLIAGAAGLAAGAMSMAAGEYVSVSSQADIEQADIAREAVALRDMPDAEEIELASIWEGRGLSVQTAALVARELTENNALDAHVRDELGLSEVHSANPLQAALASGLTFTLAGAVPMVAAILSPSEQVALVVTLTTLLALAVLGMLGAWAGGAKFLRPTLRVVFWGGAAMAVTAVIGKIFGVEV